MATVIDSLIVMLGLDSSGVKKGGKQTKDEIKGIKKEANNLGDSFKDLKKGIGEFLLVLGSAYAVKRFIVDITNADTVVARLSKNLGVSTETLSTWGNAAKQFGGSADQMQSTMKNLSMSITEMQLTGDSSILPYLRSLGVHLADAEGKALPLNDVLLQMADRFSQMDRQHAYNIARMMGLDEGTINMLLKGRKEVETVLKRQKELGIVSKRSAELSRKLQESWIQFGDAFDGVKRIITDALSPALEWLFDILTEGLMWLQKHKGVTIGVFSALAVVLTSMLVPAIMKLKVAFVFATAAAWKFAVALLANPITWITALVLALAAAIVLLYEDYRVWAEGGKSLFNWGGFGENIQAAIDKVKALWEWVTKLTKSWWKWLRARGKEVVEAVAPPAKKALSAANSAKTVVVTAGNNALANLIARGEGDYNSVNLGQAGGYRASTRNLESMTVSEVMAAQHRREFNAAGRYQIIRTTMREAVKSLGLSGKEKFDRQMQDRIFQDYLLKVKRKQIWDYVTGKTDNLKAALIAASQEWASVADPRTGKSYYAGVGNNKASITANEMAKALRYARRNYTTNNSRSVQTETHVGQINVYTNEKDGRGIARDMKNHIDNNGLITQANPGLS